MGNDMELNVAFAGAMAPLHEKYAGNLDVTAIYVEAPMNLKAHPALWDKNTDDGEITPADDNTLLLVKIAEGASESSDEAKVHPAPSVTCHGPPSNSRRSPKKALDRRWCCTRMPAPWPPCSHAIPHRCLGRSVEGSH